MTIHTSRQSVVLGAVLAAIALFGLGFFVALGVRSVVAGPDSAPAASAPNPGHSWSEIGDLPGTIWHSNNDGESSGLDADTLDGQDSLGGITSCWHREIMYPESLTGDQACAEAGGYCVSLVSSQCGYTGGRNASDCTVAGWLAACARCCK